MVVGVGERKEGFGRLLIEIKSAMYCTLYLFNGMVRGVSRVGRVDPNPNPIPHPHPHPRPDQVRAVSTRRLSARRA